MVRRRARNIANSVLQSALEVLKMSRGSSRRISSDKQYAQGKVRYFVRISKISAARKLLCVDCGRQANEYDHADYTKPLDVEPVCWSCHHKRELKRGKPVTRKGSLNKHRKYIGPMCKHGCFLSFYARNPHKYKNWGVGRGHYDHKRSAQRKEEQEGA
jgi:hypothetical protein